MWLFNSTNGHLSRNGILVGVGYSGNGPGLNNPALDGAVDVGPIPRGAWIIGQFFDDPGGKGPVVARLSPADGTDDLGRTGFLIHGDNAAMNHTASEGCIILARDIREQIAASGDTDLEVA
jgi:hypothetical protein